MNKIILPAKLENLDDLTGLIEEELDEHGCSMKVNMQVQLAAEEIFVNIASYAYPEDEEGMVEIRLDFYPCEGNTRVRITFIDSGVAYNPLLREDPELDAAAEKRQIGGLGVFMVKKSMDLVSYDYVEGQNHLTIEKICC